VHDSPIVRAHRLDGDGPAALDRFLGEAAREIRQRILSPAAIALGVDDDARPVARLLADDSVDDLLQRI